MNSKMWNRLAVFLLLVAVGLAYGNALLGDFCFDDRPLIEKSTQIRDIRNIPRMFGLAGGRLGYRPVRQASYALDYHLWGLEPFGFHLTNVTLHALCTLLVFFTVRRVIPGRFVALATAALFALHPIHTESVTYVSGRKDLLCTLFLLGSFLLFRTIRRRRRRMRSSRGLATLTALYTGHFLCYLLALGSKEMAVTLLPLMILSDALGCMPRRSPPARLADRLRESGNALLRVFRAHFGFYLVHGGLIAVGLYYFLVYRVGTFAEWHGGSPATNFLTAARVHMLYLYRMFVPARLIGDYHFDAFRVTTSPWDPVGIASLGALALIVACLVFLARSRRALAFGGLWYFVALVPVSQIRPHHELVAERFLYLPSVGFCIVLAVLCERLSRTRWRRPAITALLVLLAAYGVRIHVRNRDWRDDLTFWRVTAADAPMNARAHIYHAYNLFHGGKPMQAIASMRKGLEIMPDFPSGHYNLACIYERLAALPQAIEHYQKELERYRNRDAYFNLAGIQNRLGRFDLAAKYLMELLETFPKDVEARDALRALKSLGP